MMRLKTRLAVSRFLLSPTLANAQAALAQPGFLGERFAMGLLRQMSKGPAADSLPLARALLEALPRSAFSDRQKTRAASLFLSWFEPNPLREGRVSLAELLSAPDELEPYQVGGRRRAWALGIRLAQALAAAGASPSAEDFDRGKNEFGTGTLMVVFEHAVNPARLARRLEKDWAEDAGRRWGMAVSALPLRWVADVMERCQPPMSPGSRLSMLIPFDLITRSLSEGRVTKDAARALGLTPVAPDAMRIRLSCPASSTCLWESVDEPPALDEAIMDCAAHWGWPGVASFLRAPEDLGHARSTRLSLARQIDLVAWEPLIDRLLRELGPPSPEDVKPLEGSSAGAALERRALELSLGPAAAASKPFKRPLRV